MTHTLSAKQRFENDESLWCIVKQYLLHDEETYIFLSKEKMFDCFEKIWSYFSRNSMMVCVLYSDLDIVSRMIVNAGKRFENDVVFYFNDYIHTVGRIGCFETKHVSLHVSQLRAGDFVFNSVENNPFFGNVCLLHSFSLRYKNVSFLHIVKTNACYLK
jgi:hypothetical protein